MRLGRRFKKRGSRAADEGLLQGIPVVERDGGKSRTVTLKLGKHYRFTTEGIGELTVTVIPNNVEYTDTDHVVVDVTAARSRTEFFVIGLSTHMHLQEVT